MSFHKDKRKLLQKYKAIWTKTEDLKNTELNALPRDKSKEEKNLLVGKSEKGKMTGAVTPPIGCRGGSPEILDFHDFHMPREAILDLFFS